MKKNTELTLNEWAKAKISTTAKKNIQKRAEKTNKSESAIVRDAISFYFKHYKNKAA